MVDAQNGEGEQWGSVFPICIGGAADLAFLLPVLVGGLLHGYGRGELQ